jgi:glycosyltransferase involved in cell wall biosynthesis
VLHLIGLNRVNKVFIDGSNLGSLARSIKTQFPGAEVVTFFHNVEARFFWGALRYSWSLRGVAVLAANYVAERRAVSFSDKRVCLSRRDDRLLTTLYGKGATFISPLALKDKRTRQDRAAPTGLPHKFALFVGGSFYANLQGIRWFAEHVAPRISIDVCVVGRGLDKYRAALERFPHIRVIGGVENIEDWYQRCEFVVAPIFDGSGMKTKVAEALMFGKRVVGTPEAFSGYDLLPDDAGLVCNTSDEFVAAMESAAQRPSLMYESRLRSLYEQTYSYEAARARLAEHVGGLQ